MRFNANKWRTTYNKIQYIGQAIKDSLPTYDDNKNEIPPKKPISKEEQKRLREIVSSLYKVSNKYLDICEMKPKNQLWQYDNNDPTTWASHSSFKYRDKL
jgi:hypothetical protein